MMGYGSVKTCRNVWIQAVWVLAGGRQRRIHRASSSEESAVLTWQAEKADLLWQGSLPLFTLSLLFFYLYRTARSYVVYNPFSFSKPLVAFRHELEIGRLDPTPNIKKTEDLAVFFICTRHFLFFGLFLSSMIAIVENPFINITIRTAIT